MGNKLLHHGLLSYAFRPLFIGTDYFTFYHKPCFDQRKEPYYGHCKITAILIDNSGRIIFNLKCQSCGFRDALKTHPFLWVPNKDEKCVYKRFYISPKLKSRVKKHWWDDL
ncbi:hypothetical protein DRO69_07575 [Candidatus Bathyarchaeota archaeon]|nr:MAG: hypothetical protein DRO69_07575 [Candidatus Bathyarchaeota archaeon]RLI68385.1 MAG: hypothetical protein DRP02_12675 [Candidatus Gerdarchaeota archaeon]